MKKLNYEVNHALAQAMYACLYEIRDRLIMGQDSSGNSFINQAEIDLISDVLTKVEKN